MSRKSEPSILYPPKAALIPLPASRIKPLVAQAEAADTPQNVIDRIRAGGFTPEGWTRRAGKFDVRRDRDNDLIIMRKGVTVGYFSWYRVQLLGMNNARKALRKLHPDATNITGRYQKSRWLFTVKRKVNNTKITQTYTATERTMLLFGLRQPVGNEFALNSNLRHNTKPELDWTDDAALAVRRQINYAIYTALATEQDIEHTVETYRDIINTLEALSKEAKGEGRHSTGGKLKKPA